MISVVNIRFDVETILFQLFLLHFSEMSSDFPLEFYRLIYFNWQKLHVFLLKNVTTASCVLFMIEFSFTAFITSSVILTKREAAIF